MPLCKALRQVAAIDLNGLGGSGEPPLPNVATIDMFLECRQSYGDDSITRRISPGALAQSISSRFAVSDVE